MNGNPGSVRCDTCSQFYITQYRRHNYSGNTKLGCYNVARLRSYVCQSKRILFAHPNALPRLSTERLRTELLRIFDHTETRQDTATDESDEQDSSSRQICLELFCLKIIIIIIIISIIIIIIIIIVNEYPQCSRRVVTRSGNYTCLASVVD